MIVGHVIILFVGLGGKKIILNKKYNKLWYFYDIKAISKSFTLQRLIFFL